MNISLSDTAQWYCVVTNPGCLRRAELELSALGFRTFTPKARKWVSHARVRKAVERPILSRYLFVEVDYPKQSFGAVRAANGVEGLVSILGRPCALPKLKIEEFIRRQLAGEWDYVRSEPVEYTGEDGKPAVRQNPRLAVGARIRIMEGQFADMLATVTSVKGKKVSFKVLDSRAIGSELDLNVRAA